MDQDIRERSFAFSIKIVELYKYLTQTKKEYVLSKQVLRSGTSIGANIEEATAGSSKKDFTAKMNIALKEARETNYWLRLLKSTGYLEKDEIIAESVSIMNILGSIVKTSRINIDQKDNG